MKTKTVCMAIILSVIAADALSADEVDAIKQSLAHSMPGVAIRQVTRTPYAGLYEVVANGNTIFYTNDKAEVAIVGSMIELDTKKNLTDQHKEELLTVDFSQLPLDKAIVRVKGDGSRKLAVFSDPDCPYCKQLEKELRDITNATIYIFLYPLTEIHPDADRKAELIWCAKDPVQAWDEWMLNGKEPAPVKKKCETPVRMIAALAQKLWIGATPGIVFANGRLVPGLIPPQQIEALLQAGGKS